MIYSIYFKWNSFLPLYEFTILDIRLHIIPTGEKRHIFENRNGRISQYLNQFNEDNFQWRKIKL